MMKGAKHSHGTPYRNVAESITGKGRITTWYRGYDPQYGNFGSRRGLWVADDYDYAKMYADECGGKVVALYIDEGKLNLCPIDVIDEYLGDEFDVLEPDYCWEIGVFDRMLEDGYNCYSVALDHESVEALYLLDNSPVAGFEEIVTEESHANKIGEAIHSLLTETNGNSPVLSQSRLRCIVKRAINEVVGETPNYKIVPNSGKIKVGEYQCVDGGGFYEINGVLGQTFVGVRMYYSPSKTYCLMRNINNWKYVFTTIETTSEKDEYGGKICRFTPIRFRDLPIEIQHNFKDLTPLLRKLQQAYS